MSPSRDPSVVAATSRRHWRKKRLAAIEAYGGVCACCGEDHVEFLGIDHMNGGGRAHRAEIKASGSTFYHWLKVRNYPKGFQCLCHNCNMSLGFYGYCPHEEER